MVANGELQAMEKQGDGSASNAVSACEIDKTSEQWRHECEIRFALSLPDRSDHRRKGWKGIGKKEYLERVREKRGQAAYERLRGDMVKAWKATK